jgi:hypothetical protein
MIVDTLIFFGADKTILNNCVVQINIPGPRCLLESIKAFEQLAHIFLMAFDNISFRLTDIYFFIQLAVQKGGFDIQL